jgi:hypothetical protein
MASKNLPGPATLGGCLTTSMKNGSCRTAITSTDVRSCSKAALHLRATPSRIVRAAMTGAAMNTAVECACTASHAVVVTATVHQTDRRSPAMSTKAMVTFTSATASSGFHMAAVSDMSKGSVATSTATAKASQPE